MMAGQDSVSKVCLFVSNLPYSTTDAELEAVFKCHGSLRSCYTVKDRVRDPTKLCRGFAYVTYISRDDAQKAKSAVKVVGGRPVQVTFANKKNLWKSTGRGRGIVGEEVEGERPPGRGLEGEESEDGDDYEALTARNELVVKKQRRARSKRGSAKFDVGMVVVVTGIPAQASGKRLRKKCERFGVVEDMVFPVDSEPQTGHVTFSTHKAARLAVKGLNGAKYKKSCDSVMESKLLSQQNKVISSKTLKKSRLIIRNLSFKSSEEDIRTLFARFGPVLRVDIPKKDNGHMFGYGFVQFDSYFNASNAIAGVNGTHFKGRKVTVDWLLSKTEYKNTQGNSGCGQGDVGEKEEEGDVVSEEEDMLSEDEDLVNEVEDKGGDVGDSGESEEGSMWSEEEEEEEDSEVEGREGSEVEDSEGSEVEGWEDGEVEGREGGEVEGEEKQMASNDDLRKKIGVKRVSDDVSEGRTLFIRNLPYDAESGAVKKVVMRFGIVRYCRVMMSRGTAMATGSAFIQFKTATAAQKCLRASEQSEGVVYQGQRLTISLALSRGEIERTRQERQGRQEKEDKRNLYLMKEGAIFPESDVARDLPKADMAKRTKAYAEKKAKLANPNFYVSKTRLCVRNLPTAVDEGKLKGLCQHVANGPTSSVVQVKILRSTDRVDGKGVGRSMGYGFVELADHDIALSVLRALNNNPTIFGKLKRPIVDFAVEDSRVMKIREKRAVLRQQFLQRTVAPSNSGPADGPIADSAAIKRVAKRRKWQLKWQSRRQKRKEAREHPEKMSAGSERVNGGSQRVNGPKTVNGDSKRVIGKSRKVKLPEHMRKAELAIKTGEGCGHLKRKADRNEVQRKRQRVSKLAEKEEKEFTKMVSKYHKKQSK